MSRERREVVQKWAKQYAQLLYYSKQLHGLYLFQVVTDSEMLKIGTRILKKIAAHEKVKPPELATE